MALNQQAPPGMMKMLLQQALGLPSDNLDPSYTQTPGIIPTSTHPSKMIGFPAPAPLGEYGKPGGPSGPPLPGGAGSGAGSAQPGIFGKMDNFINSPGGGFLMNLLSQQGYSPVPQSPFGAIGRAGLMSQAQGQQRQRGELENELLRAQAGLAKSRAKAEADPTSKNPTASNVQSTFITEDGKLERSEERRVGKEC